MNDVVAAMLLFIGVLGIWLCTKRWFWKVVLFFSGLASLFALIASVIHFQILAALGFFVLCGICFGILGLISED